MVMIAGTLHQRLLDAARTTLGAGGDRLLDDIARRSLGCPLDQITYLQITRFFEAVEREAPLITGAAASLALADELDRLRVHADADLGERLVRAVADHLGPAAEPSLSYVCGRLGLSLRSMDRRHLAQLASAVEESAAALMGPAAANELARCVETVRWVRPPGLVNLVVQVATEHTGPQGELVMQELCRERLGRDLDALDIEGITLLADAVRQEGPARIGEIRTAAFVAAAREAVIDPGREARARALALAVQHLGPAAEVLVKRVSAKYGLPFEALGPEHLSWLATVLRAETAGLVGDAEAEAFAREIQALAPAELTMPNAPAAAPEPSATEGPSRIARGVRDAARTWLRA